MSDENNHKAEAMIDALDITIKYLVEEGFKEIFIVSDSPVSSSLAARFTWKQT